MHTLTSGLEDIVTHSEPLAVRTRFGLGGPAQYFAQPENTEQLITLVERCRQEHVPIRLLGGGSNVLVRDEGVPGVVVHLSAPEFTRIEVQKNRLTAGGGAALASVISTAVRAGLGGLEPLVGIPGFVGGALHGNAGTHGGDVGQWAVRARVLTRSGQVLERRTEDLVFAYRQSSLDELAILDATFQLEEDDPEILTKRMQKRWIVAKANQPMLHERTGYIFKNPRGMSAEMLISQAGVESLSVGGAEISPRHPNFILAHDGATSQDVLKLMDQVRGKVAERMGVELETLLEVW